MKDTVVIVGHSKWRCRQIREFVEISDTSWLNVGVIDEHIAITIEAIVFMEEAQNVHQFMQNGSHFGNASWCL